MASLLLAALLFAQLPTAPAPPAEKPTVVVLSFEGNKGSEELTAGVAALLGSQLAQSGGLRVVTQKDLQTMISLEKQRQLLQAGCTDQACMVELSGAVGARYVVSGRLDRFGQQVVVTSTLFDAHKSVSLAKPSTLAPTEADVPGAVGELSRAFLRALGLPTQDPPPPAQTLATVTTATVAVDAGSALPEEVLHPLEGRGEQARWTGRAELVGVQAFYGAGLGTGVAVAAQAPAAAFPVAAVGAGLFGGLSWLASQDGISHGPALAINSGTFWGAANAALVVGMLVNQGGVSPDAPVAVSALFGLSGLGLGVLTATELRPAAGQVAMANSFALWSSVIAFTLMSMDTDYGKPSKWLVPIIAADAGLLAGALLSLVVHLPRQRLFLIDLCGGLGAALGGSIIYLADGGRSDSSQFTVGIPISMVSGLALGTLLTRGMGTVTLPEVTLAPVGPHRSVGFSAGARF